MAVQSVTVVAHQAVSHVPEAEAATETSALKVIEGLGRRGSTTLLVALQAGMVIAELVLPLARVFAHLVQAIFYGVAF